MLAEFEAPPIEPAVDGELGDFMALRKAAFSDSEA
jgi:trimethylamine:corrinoid methyltransferase-like protein